MGTTEAETERLIRQSGLYAPFTRRLFERAGLGPGMRVLDVGTGAGDVALIAAEMVGASGAVVGVDRDPAVLETARAGRAALSNATFVEGDVEAPGLEGGFDAAVGRLVLMHQPNPAKTLGSVASMVRPGGVVAFQEYNCTTRSMLAFPPTPLWAEALGWIAAALERAGGEPERDFKLRLKRRGTFAKGGWADQKMELTARGGAPGGGDKSFP